ncbi:hypothetical protein TVAG_309010 [Trichomonas vaginalis G3]|uniref:Methyltransferase type 11 domain-containing protein n=1 Tax=Trichomonas vaginalis (strain ATCC PRA-98 / G3) TaxID=412133 RepID=A2EDP7_TRIV3|nr:methyltransferase protein [Trichomonas vaginalis G3]EAY09212.1 hypothetical protein TVAG_309010 [Trichomonas vaginalis G3]KAI5486793.1 methyltransferase protein [Trichomonas vaginalis G3]|eukprot:XP_001321435.1 hypothetical protein [Trichomonas vaginalis G3]
MNFAQLIKDTIVPNQQDPEQDQDHIDEELENILSHPAPRYHDPNYWNTRYEHDNEEMDWYQPWDNLKNALGKYVTKDSTILSVGCGNSPMSAQLLKEGASKVYNVDFSHVVIDQMKALHQEESNLIWTECNATKLPYDDNTFDFVFDKGTLDSFVATADSSKQIPTMLSEVCRVLKPGGIFAEISYGTPNTRTPFLRASNLQWALQETKEIEKPNEPGTYHYAYVTKKKQ